MFTTIDKAIVGVIMGALFMLSSAGVGIPDFLNQEWVEGMVALLTGPLVWLVPNKPA